MKIVKIIRLLRLHLLSRGDIVVDLREKLDDKITKECLELKRDLLQDIQNGITSVGAYKYAVKHEMAAILSFGSVFDGISLADRARLLAIPNLLEYLYQQYSAIHPSPLQANIKDFLSADSLSITSQANATAFFSS